MEGAAACVSTKTPVGAAASIMEKRQEVKGADYKNEVVVYNFDYDGALSGITGFISRLVVAIDKAYKMEYTKRQKEYEKEFWDFIDKLEERHPLAKKKVLCGSARQDYFEDVRNRILQEKPYQHPYYKDIMNNYDEGEGLVTTELERLVDSEYGKSHNWELYPLLWVDGDGETGSSWKNKTKRILYDGPRGRFWNDNKVPLLKFQIDRMVREFGTDTNICVYFFDDRKDILEALDKTFIKSKALPSNVRLSLVCLNFNDKVIDGKGDSVKLYSSC